MEKFEITKAQILEFVKWGNSKDREKVKQWFPAAFEVELEAGRWYKITWKDGDIDVFYCDKIERDTLYHKDFFRNNESFIESGKISIELIRNDDRRTLDLATDQEVEAALIKEAEKRGFNKNVNFESAHPDGYGLFIVEGEFKYRPEYNDLCHKNMGQGIIFKNGVWAKIIKTITKQEAEEKLGCKII